MKCERARLGWWDQKPAPRAVRHWKACTACSAWVREQRRLREVLNLWEPELPPPAAFMASLRRRIEAAEAAQSRQWRPLAGLRAWWQAAADDATAWRPAQWGGIAGGLAAAAIIVLGGMIVHFGQTSVPASPSPAANAAIVDLQVMDHYGDLLDNIDFLTTPVTAKNDGPEQQQQ